MFNEGPLHFIHQGHTPQEAGDHSRVTICTCEPRKMNCLSWCLQGSNSSRDVWNTSVTCTLPRAVTPQNETHPTPVLQTLEHTLKDILEVSGIGHPVDTTEHRLPIQPSPAAGTLQFRQLHGRSVGTVSQMAPKSPCFFLMLCFTLDLLRFSSFTLLSWFVLLCDWVKCQNYTAYRMQHFIVPSLLSRISSAAGRHDCFRTPGCQITFQKTMPLVIRPKKRRGKKKKVFLF